jgi:hypothetical protein
MLRCLFKYSETEGAVGQRIRYWSRMQGLAALYRSKLWFFVDQNNVLVSPEAGLDNEEAWEFLQNAIGLYQEGGAK